MKQDEDNSPVIEFRYYKNLKLFQKLQSLGLIDRAKEPRPDLEGKIFSDIELCHILKNLIDNKKPKLFSKILDNLERYTNTEVKSLIDTPMRYIIDAKSTDPKIIDAKKVLEINSAMKVVSYSCEDELVYVQPGKVIQYCSNNRIMQYPKARDLYLLEYALRGARWAHNTFVGHLLSKGANTNVMVGTPHGMRPLLWVALDNGGFPLMKLLVGHGADVNNEYNGETLLSVLVQYPIPRLDMIIESIVLGADPRQYVVTEEIKGHIVAVIISKLKLKDKETSPALRAIINSMVKKYGFDAIQAMLDSKVSSRGGEENFVDLVNGPIAGFKLTCTRLINLLTGLNQSQGCELFKVVLTDNLEMIKTFLETQSKQKQLVLMDETFSCRGKEVGIIEFVKLFCDKAVQAFVVGLKIQLLQSSAALATLESKKGEDDNKENDPLQPPSPSALGSAAGVVAAAQLQERDASTSLCSIPPLPPLPVVSVEGVQLIIPAVTSIDSDSISR